jgi:CheY-like chemotaxis protein
MALRILVVERDVHAREGLRSILSSDGHAVSVADDIWAGFARVAVQPFDLLLLDDDVRLDRHEAMLVTDLLSFARLKHGGTRGIVISTVEEDVHRYQREDGVLAVLEKPVEVPRLRRELEGLTP